MIINIILILLLSGIIYLLCHKTVENYENEYILPKTIYCYWDTFQDNQLIQSHYRNWKRRVPSDWTIIQLDKDNVSQYVDSEFMNKYSDLPSYRFADFLRLYLLLKNGGVWIDFGSFIVDGKFLDDYYNEMHTQKYDVCLYEYTTRSTKMNHVHIPYYENWFIVAPKNSRFIKDLYDEFVKAHQMNFLTYKKEVLGNAYTNLTNTLGYEDGTYLMQHAIIQILIVKNEYNINRKLAEESMFKIQESHNWNGTQIIEDILTRTDWSNIYAVKLTSGVRVHITNEQDYINKIDSL